MNKKRNFIIILALILIIVTIAIIKINLLKNKQENISNEDNVETKGNSQIDNENEEVKSLKKEYNMTGEDEIYQIIKEESGREILTIKSELTLKVAFAGMIKKSIPSKEEIEETYNQKFPKESGIYIDEKDREKIINYLNSNLNNSYKINEKGFLEIEQKRDENEIDKQIEEIINSKKTFVISINGTYYMMDQVTGEIVDNPYNDLSKDQLYEYVASDDKIILFITDNNEIDKKELFNVILDFLTMEK